MRWLQATDNLKGQVPALADIDEENEDKDEDNTEDEDDDEDHRHGDNEYYIVHVVHVKFLFQELNLSSILGHRHDVAS